MHPIFVINLNQDIERMRSVACNLTALGLSYVRVPAVLGKEVPDWEKLVDAKLYSDRNRNIMPRPGEVGCYLSHLKAMEAFLRTDAPWCVILEDDVEVLPACVPAMVALGEKNDWDLAKLFYYHSGMPVRTRVLTPTHHLVVHLTRTTSSAAYAVNRLAARTLLESMLPISEQVDHALERPWETGLRIRGIRPMPITLTHHAKKSSIGYADRKISRRISIIRGLMLFKSRTAKESRRFIHGLIEGFLKKG